MGWFKFLIYFTLFASAVLNFVYAVSYLTGNIYQLSEELNNYYGSNAAKAVYYFYPNLQGLDIIYGILLIAFAAFAIFTRFQLAGFKKKGPMFLIILYAANLVVGLIYLIGVSVITGNFSIDSSTVSSIGVSVAMTIANIIYFKKRKDLFVN